LNKIAIIQDQETKTLIEKLKKDMEKDNEEVVGG
jgi:hypothetical protein